MGGTETELDLLPESTFCQYIWTGTGAGDLGIARRELQHTADVEYIDTTSNVSDAVSRGATDVDSAQVLATHNDIDEYMQKLATGSTRDGGAGRRQRQVRMYRRQAQGRE